MKQKIKIFVTYILLLMSILIVSSIFWCRQTFGHPSIEEIMHTLTTNTSGSDSSILLSWLLKSLLVSLLITTVIVIIFVIMNKYYKHDKVMKGIKKFGYLITVLMLAGSLFFANGEYDIVNYFVLSAKQTDLYITKKSTQKNNAQKEVYNQDSNVTYVNPKDVKVTFPKKNNLIFIYLESIENTFMSKEEGGAYDINYMPELTQLAKENLSFSSTNTNGGPINFTGTTWTIASMVSQLSGLPLKSEIKNTMKQCQNFMPGAKMLGDILHEEGYYQELLIGSDSQFAGTDKLFLQHGYDQLVDYKTLNSESRVLQGDKNSWGISDFALLREAKKELTKLSSQSQPFQLTMATIDAHAPNGLHCPYCPHTYNDNYKNIIACQSKQINDFVSWMKSQSFYQNTTIIIVGDHNTMAGHQIRDVPNTYERTTYNCIINAQNQTPNIKNRKMTRLDFFPTTLSALGAKIPGDKLGLGTDLFSHKKTLIEQYGQDYLETEVKKSSDFLNTEIYE